MPSRRAPLTGAIVAVLLAHASARAAFVNFESGHLRPLALSPDESRLFSVNTPDLCPPRPEPFSDQPDSGPQLTTPGTGRADVWAFDADNPVTTDPLRGNPLSIIQLFGDTPRVLAVATAHLRRRETSVAAA